MGCSLGIPAPTGSPPPAFAQAGCIPTLFSSNPTPSPTLCGEAAEIHLRWERELKPRGFVLGARVLDFPEGVPGDIGLFLIWGS